MNTDAKIDSLSAKQVKHIFFDIDGTLVGTSAVLRPAVIAQVQRVRKIGIGISLATGRAAFGTTSIGLALGGAGPSLFFAGGLLSNPTTGKTIREIGIPADQAARFAARSKEIGVYCELYSATDYFCPERNTLTEGHAFYMGKEAIVSDLNQIAQHHTIVKIGMIAADGSQETPMRKLAAEFPDISSTFSFGSSHSWLFGNMTARAASREAGFATLTSLLNLRPEETMTFGDSEADIPFLKLAGIGVAMGNGTDKVKSSARYVTDCADEDGVATALLKFFPER